MCGRDASGSDRHMSGSADANDSRPGLTVQPSGQHSGAPTGLEEIGQGRISSEAVGNIHRLHAGKLRRTFNFD